MAEPFHNPDGSTDVAGIVKFSGTLLGTLVSLFNPAAGGAITVGVNTGVDAFAGKSPNPTPLVKLPPMSDGDKAAQDKAARSYYGLNKGDKLDTSAAYPINIPKPKGADEDKADDKPAAPVEVKADAVPSKDEPAEVSPDTDSERVEVDPDTATGPARLRAEDAAEMENGPVERDTSAQGDNSGDDNVSWLSGFGRDRYA